MEDIHLWTIAALVCAAFIAGVIDACAGGGGMITIPALLLAGIPPIEALGTNKLQSCFGSFSATLHFYQRGYIDLKQSLPFVIAAFCAAMLGSASVQMFESDFLSKLIPFLLIAFALYFLISPKVSEDSHRALLGAVWLGFIVFGIGFYDGFFGPGTGSFFIFALVILGGFNVLKALSCAKLLNLATNIASLIVFAFGGKILWTVGLCMAIGQFAGARLGSYIAISYGVRIIKPLVVIVSLCVSCHLIYKEFL